MYRTEGQTFFEILNPDGNRTSDLTITGGSFSPQPYDVTYQNGKPRFTHDNQV